MLQAFIVSTIVIAIIASSGCVGGGGNAQTFDTNHGQIQIKTPETLEPTVVGSVYAGGMLSLGKKDKGSPLIIITLTENNAYSNFQSAVSRAKIMPLLDERDLTTNDNHKMFWSTVNIAGFKQYEGIIDYGDDEGLVVSIKGLSDTADLMTGEKIPGFSENEYLDIFKSFTFVKNSGSTAKTSVSNTPSSVPVSTKPENIVLGPYAVSFDLGNVGAHSINVEQPEEEVNGTSYAAEIKGRAPSSFSMRMGILEGHEKKPVSDLEEKLREGLASGPVDCEEQTFDARTIDGKPGTLGSITCSDGLADLFFYPLDYFPEDNTMISAFAFVSLFPRDEGAYRDEAISSLLKTIHVEKRESSNAPSEINPASPSNGQEPGAFHMAVIGDSIAWGNGLNEENKYSHLVANWLEEKLNRPVDVTVYAHSGATISGESGKSIDQNLNSGSPTLMDQANNIKNKDDVDLILVSGGINDVGINNILDANTPTETISTLSESIREPMKNLLTHLLDETDAKIIVTGYYPLITEDSKVKTQDRAVAGALATQSEKTTSQTRDVLITAIADPTAAKVEAAWYLLGGLVNNAANIFTGDANLRANSDTFYAISSNSLETAVKNADNGQNRVMFIDPAFERRNSYRASDSFLWELNDDFKTNDDQYEERSKLTRDTYPLDPVKQAENNINPIAHPNRDGAAKYAKTIETVLTNKGFNWLEPSSSNKEFSKSQSTQPTETTQDPSVAAPSSDISAPSKTSSDTNTKTAYTHDGISYISKERVDENIKAGVAKPGDYEEVQVPLDTFVVGGSKIPGET